ncbi:MAG: hypothetical protein V3R73_05525 [Sphingomonadales bacterium]
MSNGEEYPWDFLSTDEAQFVKTIMCELVDEPWAGRLLRDINRNGGLTRANKARFLELRFGYALRQAGITLRYEVEGEAQSKLDFGFTASGQCWLVELMRLHETEAVKRATTTGKDADGIVWGQQFLGPNAQDPTQSEAGETIKAVQRICQKCERNGEPHKFPIPDAAYHVMLVDFRIFLQGGDEYDRIHVGLGAESVPEKFCRRYWNRKPILGAFSPDTEVHGAPEIRERVHFLGFVCEKTYENGAFGRATQFIANPNLLQSTAEVQSAIATWPLRPARVLNGGR